MKTDSVIYNHSTGVKVVDFHKVISTPKFEKDLGSGIVVGIIDVGYLDTINSDIVHALTSTTLNRFKNVQVTEEIINNAFHANCVASLIAGKDGIAKAAKLEVFCWEGALYDENYNDHFELWVANSIREAISLKVDFINLSIGFRDWGDQFPAIVTTALYSARDAGIGIILSASNDNNVVELYYNGKFGAKGDAILGDTIYKGLDEILENMNGYMRIAVATNYSNDSYDVDLYKKKWDSEKISSFSNLLNPRCRKFALAAPGEDILTYGINQETLICGGTSFSAPIITASAAVLKSECKVTANKVFNALDGSARKTKFNIKTEEEYKEAYCFNEDNKVGGNYYNFRKDNAKLGLGRGLSVKTREGLFTPAFNDYIKKEYEINIRLDPQQFGQGVIDLTKALEISEREKDLARDSYGSIL